MKEESCCFTQRAMGDPSLIFGTEHFSPRILNAFNFISFKWIDFGRKFTKTLTLTVQVIHTWAKVTWPNLKSLVGEQVAQLLWKNKQRRTAPERFHYRDCERPGRRVTLDSHSENIAKSDFPSASPPAIRNLANRFSPGNVPREAN